MVAKSVGIVIFYKAWVDLPRWLTFEYLFSRGTRAHIALWSEHVCRHSSKRCFEVCNFWHRENSTSTVGFEKTQKCYTTWGTLEYDNYGIEVEDMTRARNKAHLCCRPVRFSRVICFGKLNEVNQSKTDVLSVGLITSERLALLRASDVYSWKNKRRKRRATAWPKVSQKNQQHKPIF